MKSKPLKRPILASAGPSAAGQADASSKRLPLGFLTALVIGSMVGSGIFSMPQNMAAGAGPGAVLLAWIITGAGMFMLARLYQTLALRKPELNNGVYAYAQISTGDFIGFHSAWGYWISAWAGNTAYLVILFGTLGYFFPAFGEGNTPAAIGAASLMLWLTHAMVLGGAHGAARLNAVITVIKVIVLLVYIAAVALAFKRPLFLEHFWGQPQLGSVSEQIKSTLLVTVWVFIGIEGASVLSERAQRRADIGRATVLGFIAVLLLLMAISLLSFGVMSQTELSTLKNPSMAGVMARLLGPWGTVFINTGLLLSVGGSLLAWTLLAAETLFTPACSGAMPRFLTRTNRRGTPVNALWLTSGLTQLLLLVTLASRATYQALILLSAAMVLIPYLFSAVCAFRLAITGETYTADSRWVRGRDMFIGGGATLYCLWLLYGAGLKYLFLTAVLYAPGSIFYVWAKRQQGKPVFKPYEAIVLVLQLGLAAIAVWLLTTDALRL